LDWVASSPSAARRGLRAARAGRQQPSLAVGAVCVACALTLGAPSASAVGRPPAPLDAAKPVTSYRLDARLDAQHHSVHARETIFFRNVSQRPLDELWFHLYLNAFENERTLYLRDAGGRSGKRLGAPGHLRVLWLKSARYGAVDLWKASAPHSPHDARDRTDIRVPLPDALPPGETIELELEFEAQLPQIVERTGYEGSFHLVAQWFPKLARLEPGGTFVHFAFHPHAEFFADFGEYEVRLDVPEEHVVGSTGELQLENKKAGRAHYRARASGVHDFAWTSAPALALEKRHKGAIEVSMLGPQGQTRALGTIDRTLDAALPYYQTAYGAYPYPTLTVVQPPSEAGRSGGMEYPTFFTAGGSALMGRLGVRWLETVTAHELAHQWFYGLVATNEAEYPFLDEGLTSHAEWRFLEHAYGAGSQIDLLGFRVSRAAVGRYSGLSVGPEELVAQPARDFSSFRSLAGQVYGKTALALETLRRVYGPVAFDAALRAYAIEKRFRHPKPREFYESIERGLGTQARRALETLLARRGRLDVRVGEITTRHDWSCVTILTGGNVVLPLEVEIEFTDGRKQLHFFADPRPLEKLEFAHDLPIAVVRADPEQKLFIDENLLNNRGFPNGKPAPTATAARLSWLGQWALRVLRP